MEPDDLRQRPTFGAFLRDCRDNFRERRWVRLQLASAGLLAAAAVVRHGFLATMVLLGLTVLATLPIGYGTWRWANRKRR